MEQNSEKPLYHPLATDPSQIKMEPVKPASGLKEGLVVEVVTGTGAKYVGKVLTVLYEPTKLVPVMFSMEFMVNGQKRIIEFQYASVQVQYEVRS